MAIGWLTVLSSIVSFRSKKHSDLPPISTVNFKYKNFKYKNIIVIYIYIYIYIRIDTFRICIYFVVPTLLVFK